MATEFCPQCHQPISQVVAGVRLPIFKAELFHFIESHPGQSSGDLAQHFSKRKETIRVHIWQINDELMDIGVKIRGSMFTGYYVEKAAG
jgi:transcriptional antiterminator